MMSERRFRVEVQSPTGPVRVGCNLCGCNGASVRCDKCDSMAFCLSCDDMYHRHPKRRYHLRKAVAIDRPKIPSNPVQNHNVTNVRSNGPIEMTNMGHPSKMPVPPPRRKKKGITLSSIKETFANTGDRLRRWVSNEKLSPNNKYQTECRPTETPLIQRPMETIRTHNLENLQIINHNNQMRTIPKINSSGTLPVNAQKNSYPPPRTQEPLPAPPVPPPPLGPKPSPVLESMYQNYRKTSLPGDHRVRRVEVDEPRHHQSGNLSNVNGRTKIGVSSSIGDLSAEMPAADVQRKFSVNTFDRRNCSLHDLRRKDTSIDDISTINGQPFFPQVYPQNGVVCGYPVHPWVTSSLNNSIEDIQLNDFEDYDSDASARHHSSRMKRASIKRAQSAFQMYPGSSQCCHGTGTLTPMQPYPFYPYPYYGNPYSGHTSPMPPYATPHRAQSFKMINRSSGDNMSTTSSSRDISSKDKHRHKKKNQKADIKDFSDSMTSSSRQQSDFDDDDEHFFSVSDDTSGDSHSLGGPGQWSCKFCTYINDNSKTVCEICSKTNKKLKKISYKNSRKPFANENTSKVNDNCDKTKAKFNKNEDYFDESLINEQKEIEKELIRRLENERRIDRQNERIARKEEYLRRKSLGLPIEDSLKEAVKKDHEEETKEEQTNPSGNISSSDANNIRISDNNTKNLENSDDNRTQNIMSASNEPNKAEESGEKSEEKDPMSVRDTAKEDNHFSAGTDVSISKEKCAKSIECQTEDNTFVECKNGFTEETNENKTTGNESPKVTSNSDCDPNKTIAYNNQSNHTNTQNQNQNSMSVQNTAQTAPTFPPVNSFDERRLTYGSDQMYSSGISNGQIPFQNPYNNYSANPMMPSMSQNFISPMSPVMPGYGPMAGHVFSMNPMHNIYSPPSYAPSLNGSQTGLDRFGYRSNSISSEQSFMSPMAPQFGSRYSSCESLQTMNPLNEKNQQKSQMESGLHLVQVLREAERNGFTADDLEVAINFSPDKPLDWLEENWNNMCETVLTLANNQIVQNEAKSGHKKLSKLNMLTEDEAKEALRAAKGNIWQAIDRCVKAKQPKISKDPKQRATPEEPKKSFSFKISGAGSGKDNDDSNQTVLEQDGKQTGETSTEEQTDEETTLLTTISVQKIDVQQIETITDRKALERLLNDWKIEKLSSDRSRLQEKERQRMRKLLELQRKMSEFDSEDSDEQEFTADEHELERDPIDHRNNRQELREDPFEEMPVAGAQWQVNSEFVDASPNKDSASTQESERSSSDTEEYISNADSDDLSDDFDKIDARIQKRLEENLKKNSNLTVDDSMDQFSSDKSSIISDDKSSDDKIENETEKEIDLGEGCSYRRESEIEIQSQEVTIETRNSEEVEAEPMVSASAPVIIDSEKEFSKSEAKKLMKEIDNNVRQSLEELEQMEEQLQESNAKEIDVVTVEESQSPKEADNTVKDVRRSIFDESFEWARTEYECELCCGVYSIEDLVSMISCTHFACKECLQKYFAVQIREQQRLVICCPFCEEPAINADEDDKVFEYLGLLDQIIKYLVPTDIYELFQRKLRDRALMRDPNFLWCSQCGSGFIAPNLQAKTVMCPDCKAIMCPICKKKWKKQHFDTTCEEFAEWENANDPTYAEQQLDKHLQEFGIECPNCKFRYQLAKGGCMHFRCIQCSYDFCGGCARPFKMGFRCGRSPFCEKLGLHAHHPRNCLFYLRDKDTKLLQTLLDKYGIAYKTEVEGDQKRTRCPVMEQKETDRGKKDDPCNRYIESAGLCRLHYKEYLGDLIWKNNIDPIDIFSDDELELVLQRENIRRPPRSYTNRKEEREQFKKQLIEIILDKLPLNSNPEAQQG